MTAEDRAAHVEREAVAGVLKELLNEHMISVQGVVSEDRCEVLHPDEYKADGTCIECTEHAADLLHDGFDDRVIRAVLAALPQAGEAAAVLGEAFRRVAANWSGERLFDLGVEDSCRVIADYAAELGHPIAPCETAAALTAGADQ